MNIKEINKAWHAVGADVAGLKWEDFVKHLCSTPPAAQPPVPAEWLALVKEARRVAMTQTGEARIPECGHFGAIAQDLDYLLGLMTATPPAAQPAVPDFKVFKAWANDAGYDTAHTHDGIKWVCLNPMTADLWKAWQAANTTPPAAPVQEPDGYMHELIENGGGVWLGVLGHDAKEVLKRAHTDGETSKDMRPFWFTPPAAQRQPLSDEQIRQVMRPLGWDRVTTSDFAFVRAIEQAHNITGEKK